MINYLHCHPQNNYNNPVMDGNLIKQAVAVRVRADKVAFYNCSFFGMQDTLWDDSGRHLYQSCYIRGNNWNDPNGFVFKSCTMSRNWQVYLGRAWRPYARVLFYNTFLSDNVVPQGRVAWVTWNGEANVSNLLSAESGCYGPGSTTAKQVPWEKILSAEEVNTLTSRSFIDEEGEQVVVDRSYIYIQGEGQKHTVIDYSNSTNTLASCTFAVTADNFVAKNIAFKNNHDRIVMEIDMTKQAVAARVSADKVAFYNCSFIGVQDTLWDDTGRHLYQSCYIQGNNWNEPNGFVFMGCNVSGHGNVYLGRAWRPYARVLFYKSCLSDDVIPKGWEAWAGSSNVSNLIFAESDCSGPGSDTSKRVPWEKKLSAEELNTLTSRSFIDAEGWIEEQP
ncbi:pectinesterase QRT1-like protein [Cinnamomum micranthum f. kanehirae]|uniref:pectinesterase n=1 Tax=Cinnamomum micranthum f. kanehirae TaxID=337451 RepID=A0A3S3P675_9MAGN|nr:pectinesterase QRT1-like protein [Cinnamomum micranthum f. kanehirae]